MPLNKIGAVFSLGIVAALTLSCHRAATTISTQKLRHANVLIISLDTTRADHLGAYGYAAAHTPTLDKLASDGILFESCITPTAYTLPSHSSIMTGLYPPHHGVRINGEAALAAANTTLAEKLTANGYRTGAFVGAFVLDGRWGLSQGFQTYDDKFVMRPDQRLDLASVQRPADQVVDLALKWLDADKTKPFFAWVHLYDAHTPYEPPEPFRSQFANAGEKALYDGEIAFADSQVARLLEWLDRNKRAENTVVVVVGDHGEGLGSHGEDEHGYFIYDYAVHVPLILRIPGAGSARIPSQVRTVDIFPTITHLVLGETATKIEGASLVPLITSAEEPGLRYAYSESMAVNLQYGWAALYGLRSNEYKFIEAPRSELYNLKEDPAESVNRLDHTRRVARQMRGELLRVREQSALEAPKVEQANLDPETVRMLASLGYVGGSSGTVSDDQNLADPKDKIYLFEAVGHAAFLIAKDDYKQATEVLERVLQEDPKVHQAQLLIATTYRKLGENEKAKSVLDRYLKEQPGDMRALVAMAGILLHEGKRDEVLAICRRALAEDQNNTRAYELMADVYIASNDHAEALPLLRKVVEIQPKLTRSRVNLAAALIGVGQSREAEQQLDDVIKEHPKFPLAHYHLALLREEQGRFADARAAYEDEVKNNPKSFVARFNLGNLLFRLGDADGAEEQMRVLIKEDAKNPRPYLFLGRVLLTRPGHLAEVETLARAGLERSSEAELKALGYFLLADVYSRQGRRAELQDALRNGQRYRALIKS